MKEYSDEIIEFLVYVKPSKYRQKILISLKDEKLKIPSEIARDVGVITSHISIYLSGLKEKNLIKCINEEATKGRLYHITENGKKVLKYI
ncbi:transcriptional regulator [Methanobrevibacter arboriphilus JCM 13429 = DSM 1125]|uniref:Transcriptional regulator n=1 Tax=Methanobrevibacter arboriphilus JCM 13429 = DSM 1125 TaxID=1300164 RepID=A0A1V6N432_METAZ|nr:hypothetical protein [Methanobrevibacter arboriphilus]OQD59458.1 transcriptional regulator [Methanobrevibacter arboriphilus JCM 13429 = DSM 1125]